MSMFAEVVLVLPSLSPFTGCLGREGTEGTLTFPQDIRSKSVWGLLVSLLVSLLVGGLGIWFMQL